MKLVFLLLFLAPSCYAQMVIEGTVTDRETHATIADAQVRLRIGSNVNDAVTDAKGAFRFTAALPEGGAAIGQIRVTREDYLDARLSPELRAETGKLRIEMQRAALLKGRVTQDDGYGAEGTQAELLQYGSEHGTRKLIRVDYSPVDEQGQFDFRPLASGTYYLRVLPYQLTNWDQRYVTEYFPDATEASGAKPIQLKGGEHRVVEMRMTKHEGVTVSGRAIESTDSSTTSRRLSVRLGRLDTDGHLFKTTVVQRPNGTFAFRHVQPGKYLVHVRSGTLWGTDDRPPEIGEYLAEQRIEVGAQEVRDLALTVRMVKPRDLNGAVMMEAGENLARSVTVVLRRIEPFGYTQRASYPEQVRAVIGRDRSFVFNGLMPGHYVPEIQGAAYLTSFTVGGEAVRDLREGFDWDDRTQGPLTLQVSSRMAKLTGTVVDAAGKPVGGAYVQLQSESSGSGTTTRADGTFTFERQVPGTYLLYAAPDRSQTAPDPAYASRYEKEFPPVQLVPGDNGPVTLRLPARVP
jgi:hypothetical protein